MTEMRDEFLSAEDLDLRNLSWEELLAYWDLWLRQAQATNDLDEGLYSHGVFESEPATPEAIGGKGRGPRTSGMRRPAGSRFGGG